MFPDLEGEIKTDVGLGSLENYQETAKIMFQQQQPTRVPSEMCGSFWGLFLPMHCDIRL